MIRIGQIGDLHVTDGPRFRDTTRCIDWVIEDGARQGVQLWILGGDLTGTTVPHESWLAERNYIDTVIQRMADQGPVVIVRGNHDMVDDIEGYGRLHGAHPIHLVTTPRMVTLEIAGESIALPCLPYPDKALLTNVSVGSIKETNRAAADTLRAVLRQWKTEIDPNRLSIAAMHLLIAGCELAGGEVLADQEVELYREDLEELGVDWVALSHIHKCQLMTARAAYAGSPNAQDFGAIDDKGYLIVDLQKGSEPQVHRRYTPSRKMVTVGAEWKADEEGRFGWVLDTTEVPAGAEVRVRAVMPESQRGTCERERLEEILTAAGAHAVKVEPKVIPTNRVRSEAIGHARTSAERIQAYWDSLGAGAPTAEDRARCIEKLTEIAVDGQRRELDISGDALIPVRLKTRGMVAELADEIEIDFERIGDGIVAFVGENGSGKTHLLELSGPATWFGEFIYYDCKIADHVPRTCRDAFADLTWRSGESEFRALIKVDRQFSGGAGKTEGFLWRDGIPLASSGKMSDYKAAIARYIPTKRFLQASAVAAQGGGGNFFDLKKADRKDMIIRELGLDGMQEESRAADARASRCTDRLEETRRRIAVVQGNVSQALAVRSAIEQAVAEIAGISRDLDRAKIETAAAAAALESDRFQLARAEEQAAERASERARLMKALSEHQMDLDRLEAEIASMNRVLASLAEIEAAAAEAAQIDLRLPDLGSSERKLAEEIRALDAQIAKDDLELVGLRAEGAQLIRQLKEIEAAEAQLEHEKALTEKRTIAIARVAEIQTQISAVEANIATLEEAAQREADAHHERGKLQARIDALKPRTGLLASVDADHPMCAVCPAIADARNTKSEISRLEADLAVLPATPEVLASEMLRLDRRTAKDLIDQRTEWQASLNAAERELAALAPAKALAARRAETEAAVTDLNNKGVPLRHKLDGIKADREVLSSQLSSTRADVDALGQRRLAVAPVAARMPEVAAAQSQRSGRIEAAERVQVTVNDLRDRLASVIEEDLAAMRAVVERSAKEAARLEDAQTAIASTLRAAESRRDHLQGELAGLGDPEAELAQLQADEAALVIEISDWTLLAKALGRDGAQALCLSQAGPIISEIANQLLQACFDSRFTLDLVTQLPKVDGVGFKEVFDVQILDAEKGAIEKGCGGESVMLGESLRLAMNIFNIQTSGYQVRALWRDESSDGLDEKNRDKYIQMLRRAMQIGGIRRIFLISHDRRVWSQADARLFVAPRRGDREAGVFLDNEQAWRDWLDGVDADLIGLAPSERAEAA